jgi:hypothetical protein
MGKLAERRGRKASGLTDSFPKTAGLPRGRNDSGNGFATKENSETAVNERDAHKRALSPPK